MYATIPQSSERLNHDLNQITTTRTWENLAAALTADVPITRFLIGA